MLRMYLRWALVGLAAVFSSSLAVGASAVAGHGAASYKLAVSGPGEPRLALHAVEQGQGSPVVLLHGLGGSVYSWRFIAPALARRHRVIAIDLKGFGSSDKAFDQAYSAADQARLVARFLQRRGLTGVTLVGHSFGGQVALLTALELKARDPARISRLVLIDAPALPQQLSPIVALMQAPIVPYALLTLTPPGLVTRLALTPSPMVPVRRSYTNTDADAYAAPFEDPAARHAYIQTSRQIAPPNLSQIVRHYPALRQPTLLVWCARDEVVPVATGRALARMLRNARLDELDGCNHSPPDENPYGLLRSLTRFLTH
jgi:pimeloyl-ACP methyl ester carboxylesterase